MKIFKFKNRLLLGVAFFTFCGVNGFGQSDVGAEPVDEESKCWCKQESQSGSTITVINLDSVAASNPDGVYQMVGGCEGADCAGECGMETVRSGDIAEGECTGEPYGDTDLGGEPGEECECILKRERNGVTVYINASQKAGEEGSGYEVVRKCNDDCSSRCEIKITNHHGSETFPGFCTDTWPKGDSKKAAFLSVDTEVEESALYFYPNPANNTLNVKGADNIRTVIYSVTGEVVLESKSKEINIQSLTKGTYLVRLLDANGVVYKDVLLVE